MTCPRREQSWASTVRPDRDDMEELRELYVRCIRELCDHFAPAPEGSGMEGMCGTKAVGVWALGEIGRREREIPRGCDRCGKVVRHPEAYCMTDTGQTVCGKCYKTRVHGDISEAGKAAGRTHPPYEGERHVDDRDAEWDLPTPPLSKVDEAYAQDLKASIDSQMTESTQTITIDDPPPPVPKCPGCGRPVNYRGYTPPGTDVRYCSVYCWHENGGVQP